MLKASVQEALSTITAAHPDWALRVIPDGQGGAWIEAMQVALEPPYAQPDTFLVFLLPFNLPGSDIYPMFLRADLSRLDGQPLGEGFQPTQLSWPGQPDARPVVQVSRRTRGSAFTSQTAAQKVDKVLQWVQTR